MISARILVVGAGIGGLTSAIALRSRGFDVDVIERDPEWSVYGVGIIQQSNVVRAMNDLGVLEDYLGAGFGFDHVDVYAPGGQHVAAVPSPRLAAGFPANVGIARPALHKVLGDRTIAAGAVVRLGVTVVTLVDDGAGVDVTLSDGSAQRYDLVIGADGIYSSTRGLIFPDTPPPAFTGQGVWRYNLPRPDDLVQMATYQSDIGIGLVPLSHDVMYMFVTTPEDGGRYPREGLAAAMRAKLASSAPAIAALREAITDDDGVVYRPLETLFVDGPWHRGRVVLIGDAVHATTPHLGQGAGMAIEDSIVLADELARATTVEEAFVGFEARRFERCRFIVDASLALCRAQVERRPHDQAAAMRRMFEVVSAPL